MLKTMKPLRSRARAMKAWNVVEGGVLQTLAEAAGQTVNLIAPTRVRARIGRAA